VKHKRTANCFNRVRVQMMTPVMSMTVVRKISGDFMSWRNIILHQYSIEIESS